MQFKVMSRRDCVKYSYGSHEESSIVISINDSAEMGVRQLANKFNNIKAQLSLFFDDIQPYKGMQYWKKDEGSIVENFTNSDGFVYESRIYQLMTKMMLRKLLILSINGIIRLM